MAEKLGLRKNIQMFRRGYGIAVKAFGRQYFLSQAASALVEGVRVFPNIYLSALIINELAGARDVNRLITLAAITVAVNALLFLLSGLTRHWQDYATSQSWLQTEFIYAEKMYKMDFRDVESPKTAELLETIRGNNNWGGWGFNRFRHFISNLISAFVKTLCAAALTVTLFSLKVPEGSPLAFMNSPLMLIAILAILAAAVFLPPSFKSRANSLHNKQSDKARFGNRIFHFYGWELPQAKRQKDARIYNQAKAIDDFEEWNKLNGWAAVFKPVMKVYALLYGSGTAISFLSSGFVYLFVALKALGGAFGVGSIVQYVGAITQFTEGIGALVSQIAEIFDNNLYLKIIFDFLDIPNAMHQGEKPLSAGDDADFEFEFRNVSFRYPATEDWALHNVSIRFGKHRRTAIVGMNGSGKTTFIKLLCRLYDPTEGEILLNGVNIRDYDYDSYMAIFSVVFQDFKLFPLPLGENVAVGKDYDAARAEAVLREAGFGDRLDKLDEGLKTQLYHLFDDNDGGISLSGGEEQKIALARALYKPSGFVILDEPTAALDPLAEYEIYSKFNDFVGKRGAVFISHRLSSCRFCDDIAVFDKGSLVQYGEHERLLEDKDGKYNELWMAQAQYYAS